RKIISNASNIRTGENPSYTLADFLDSYPQFAPAGEEGAEVYLVPEAILESFVALAHASIKEARYHDAWAVCMGFFIAHFATLWLEGTAAAGSSAAKVLAAAKAKGLRTSKSVDGVSVSYDYAAIAQDLDGWAAWKLTIYGQQLATMGKLFGLGGMGVW
ncbi:MAG TPA: DUF4054 domain-containing protein, partial [Pelotomaculum sp.]|nr:DUF4054 domain-containing protein [Pelotomaculum sp.]